MTPKQRVLKRWPRARAHSWAGPAWIIYAGDFLNESLNVSDPTARQAWAAAAKHKSVAKAKRRRHDGTHQ